MLDDELCAANGAAGAEPARLRLDVGQREAFVAAMSAEVVRWLERRIAARAASRDHGRGRRRAAPAPLTDEGLTSDSHGTMGV
jgi:hypothetical protein